MRQVEVQLPSHPYTATIESGLLTRAGELLCAALPDRSRYFVITVPRVKKLWAKTLTASLAKAELVHTVIEMRDGERAKTLETVRDLAIKLVRRGADRKSAIIALGGGVVGDLAAFLASIYMRGIDVVQIPTTFLAQVDASIGGKTGVDLPEGKNLLGTFHQPRAVLIDPGVLTTLAPREYRSGLYEALKCGIIRRPDRAAKGTYCLARHRGRKVRQLLNIMPHRKMGRPLMVFALRKHPELKAASSAAGCSVHEHCRVVSG